MKAVVVIFISPGLRGVVCYVLSISLSVYCVKRLNIIFLILFFQAARRPGGRQAGLLEVLNDFARNVVVLGMFQATETAVKSSGSIFEKLQNAFLRTVGNRIKLARLVYFDDCEGNKFSGCGSL